MKNTHFFFSLLLFLTSCATPYQPNGLGGGYSDFKLADDTYMVTFRGNGYTSADYAFKYGLRRCAELTKQNGYNYFVVLDSSTSIHESTYVTPVQAHTNSVYTGSTYGNYGYINGNSTTTYTGGNVNVVKRPYISISIKMYTDSVLNSYNADVILSNFQSKQPSVSQSTNQPPNVTTSTQSLENNQSSHQHTEAQANVMVQNDNTHENESTSEQNNIEKSSIPSVPLFSSLQ